MPATTTLSHAKRAPHAEVKKPQDASTVFLATCAVVAAISLAYVVYISWPVPPPVGDEGAAFIPSAMKLEEIPFPGQQAYDYLKHICALGPRVSGSEGMRRQQAWLTEHFEKLGGKVNRQEFQVAHPVSGAPVTLANLVVEWHPERHERLLLCTHYDTRPFPDRDRKNPRGTFLGANDGGSGTALLCALAHQMKDLPVRYGVDFVLFDGEELVFDDARDRYFLGSEHFASEYAAGKLGRKYRWGVLLDMVGDADLQIYQEINSLRWPDTRPLVKEIWDLAAELKVKEFIDRPRHEVRDDHLPLHDTGRISIINLIDFDYPRPGAVSLWHTQGDLPENCSALSLAKVGFVVSEWLKRTR